MTLLERISAHNDERSARLAGIGLMLLSIFTFSFGDAIGKFIVATYSVGQLLWLRACAALFVLSPLIWRHRAQFLHMERPRLQLLRVILSTIEVAAFFLATVYLPLADVAVRLGHAEPWQPGAVCGRRPHLGERAIMRQPLAEACAGKRRGALPIFDDCLGDYVRPRRVRRCPVMANDRGRRAHHRRGDLYFPARANPRA